LQIRGSFLKDYAKIVNATREADWDRYLLPLDREILSGMILPSQWYPAETMGRIARGLLELHSGGSYEYIRAFSRAKAPDYLSDVKSFLLRNDIKKALDAYVRIADRWVDEIEVKVEGCGEGVARISFCPVRDAPSFDCYREVQAGNLEWLVEANGGADPKAEFETEERSGKEACTIKLRWTEERRS